MSSNERRDGARYLTDLYVVLRAVKGGEVIDERATAHEVSLKGFKLETQAQLAEKTLVTFTLDLHNGGRAEGAGRVVWSNRETFATWAGVEITSMSWGDKRRLKQMLYPDSVDWVNLSAICTKLLVTVTVLIAAHKFLYRQVARVTLVRMAPKIIALMVMGWALLGIFKRDRR